MKYGRLFAPQFSQWGGWRAEGYECDFNERVVENKKKR